MQTSDEGTSYCRQCDAYARNLDQTKEELKKAVDDLCSLATTIRDKEIKRFQRLATALEYIEMTGGNYGHDGLKKSLPCPCGQCMANEASKALQIFQED